MLVSLAGRRHVVFIRVLGQRGTSASFAVLLWTQEPNGINFFILNGSSHDSALCLYNTHSKSLNSLKGISVVNFVTVTVRC